jgi:ABC-2 type transport system ATP-binding protein
LALLAAIVLPMLTLQRLSKRFGAQWALQELDLRVGAGEIQCLLGANGAGKTTALNLVLGFLSPTAGAAYVNGIEVAGNAVRIRAQLAFVPEQVSLYPLLTGRENLVYFTQLSGKYDVPSALLLKYLDQVGLERSAIDARVERYSKGMRQKVALAIALAKGAKALLLDEPLSGLDPKAANEFCALVRDLAQGGAAVLMATHDLFRAKELGGRLGIMRAGRLLRNLAAADVSHAQLDQIYLDCMHDDGVSR